MSQLTNGDLESASNKKTRTASPSSNVTFSKSHRKTLALTAFDPDRSAKHTAATRRIFVNESIW
jgi:hypothetical protein